MPRVRGGTLNLSFVKVLVLTNKKKQQLWREIKDCVENHIFEAAHEDYNRTFMHDTYDV